MSEIPGTAGDVVWQSSPPGSIYDYIRIASFSIGPDGLIEQWSRRAAGLFGVAAHEAMGKDPVEAFMPAELRGDGHRRIGEVLDGKEWTGLVPFRMPGEDAVHGLAEIYVMPSETATGERAAVCIVVDVRALRLIETDLAASQAIFGQSPFGFVLFGTDLTVVRANERFATVFGGRADDHQGRTVGDYLTGLEADRLTTTLEHVLATGDSVTDLQLVGTAPGDTERRHWSMNLYRVHSGSGRPIGIAGLATDVTRRHIAAREAASARRNLALLNEASARIGNSLDLETTARELLDVAVPGFCDLASVDLYQALLTGEETPPGSGAPCAGKRSAAPPNCAASPTPAPCPTPCPTPPPTPPPTAPRPTPPIPGRSPVRPHSVPCTTTPSARPAPSPCAPDMWRTCPATTAASSGPRSPCRWSPTTPWSASCSSPARRAASPSASGTAPWPPNSPHVPPSASTTPASTAVSTNAR